MLLELPATRSLRAPATAEGIDEPGRVEPAPAATLPLLPDHRRTVLEHPLPAAAVADGYATEPRGGGVALAGDARLPLVGLHAATLPESGPWAASHAMWNGAPGCGLLSRMGGS